MYAKQKLTDLAIPSGPAIVLVNPPATQFETKQLSSSTTEQKTKKVTTQVDVALSIQPYPLNTHAVTTVINLHSRLITHLEVVRVGEPELLPQLVRRTGAQLIEYVVIALLGPLPYDAALLQQIVGDEPTHNQVSGGRYRLASGKGRETAKVCNVSQETNIVGHMSREDSFISLSVTGIYV